MRVDIDSGLGGCPDECPYALVDVDHEEIRSSEGVAVVYVKVDCVHRPVCRHRRSGLPEGNPPAAPHGSGVRR